MTWFKVDDSFYDHPKLDDVEFEAVGLWAVAGSYCSKHLTDGFVSLKRVFMLGGNDEIAAQLVRSGLWKEVPGGYEFNDWHDYQPTRDEVLERQEREREQTRERVRKYREKKKQSNADGNANVTGVTTPFGNAPVTLLPTRPDPTHISTRETRKKRAHSLPDDFCVTDDMRNWAAEKVPDVDVDHETDKFTDWCRANGKTYVDWTAAWRNWLKKAVTYQRGSPKKQTGSQMYAELAQGGINGHHPDSQAALTRSDV